VPFLFGFCYLFQLFVPATLQLAGRQTIPSVNSIVLLKRRLASLNGKQYSLTALKKMIFRTVVEEIIVRTDLEKKALQFTIHWMGGTHSS